ncbi:MAG: winged helix-turn-helix transcriptional regulator [Saprospiraceae bacterium]|nr:winged helix-turn-helix transcriptional regulator [Saprospiraceae bacterium]
MERKLSPEFFEMYGQMKRRNVFRVIIRYGKYMAARAEAIAHEHGYPNFKLMYMGFLANVDPNGSTASELARCIHVTKQAMSKMVKEIEREGYVEFRPHENDGRASVIHLTPRGEDLLRLGVKISEELKSEMVAGVGEAHVEHLIDTLQTLMEKAEWPSN